MDQSARWRQIFFFSVYVFQGLPEGFSLTTLSLFLAHKGLGPEQTGQLAAWIGLPWAIKFLWGPVFDRVRNERYGRRRLPILVLATLCCLSLSPLLLVDDPLRQLPYLTAIFCLHAVFASMLDTVVDGLAVEIFPEDQRGRGSAAMMTGRITGWALGSAGLSQVLALEGFSQASAALLVGIWFLWLIPWLVRDGASSPPSRPALRFVYYDTLLAVFTRQSFILVSVVCLVDLAVSIARRTLEYSFVTQHNWAAEQISMLKGVSGAVLAIAVVTGVGWLVDRKGARRVAKLSILGLLVVYLIIAVFPIAWSSTENLTLYNVFDVSFAPAFGAAMAPLLMGVCRKEVEASQYATYQGLFNLSDVAGAALFGRFHRLLGVDVTLLCCCGSLALAAILLLGTQRRI